MKIKSLSLATAFLVATTFVRADTNELSGALQKGLFEEEANRNLDAAIEAYQSVAARFDKDRQLAATAIFRLGECYRKLGKTNEAVAQYERIVREFSDQTTLVTLSRQNLVGLGATQSSSVVANNRRSAPTATTSEAAQLAVQLRAIESLKDDPEKQARAVYAIFQDNGLEPMLRNLPRLQEQAKTLGANPEPKPKSLYLAVGPNGILLSTGNEPYEPQKELQRQVSLIQERVNFTLGVQKARLAVLQSAQTQTPSESAGQQNAAQAEAASLHAQIDELKGLTSERRRIAVQQKIPNPVLNSLMQDLSRAEQNLVSVRKDYGPTHTEVQKAAAVLETINKQIDAQLEGVLLELQIKMKAALQAAQTSQTSPEKSDKGFEYAIKSGETLSLIAQNNREQGIKVTVDQILKANPKLDPTKLRVGQKIWIPDVEETMRPELGKGPTSNDEEEKEIRRIQGMIENSPDLINARVEGVNGDLTLLCLAASKGQLRVATFLLESAAAIDGRSGEFNWTALHFAADGGHKAMVELLAERGADINARNNNGETALHLAAAKGYQSVAEALIQRKADVNARSKKENEGVTPLHRAATQGLSEMVAFLISKGAEVDTQNARGMTALSRAAVNGHTDVINKLLAAGAKPDIEDEWGLTALSYAAMPGHIDSVKALLAAKADPNAEQSRRASLLGGDDLKTGMREAVIGSGSQPERQKGRREDASTDIW